ncbi:hypothetical protein [Stenotrophomonas phage BUCTxx99]|nr:hypothetical protein [Stenotrophomonas phage BUCTxx99]
MPHLQMFNHKIRRMDQPFDDTRSKIVLHLNYGWDEKWYWWWFADNPQELEWRCVGSDIQVKIEGAWTDAIWLGSEKGEWAGIVRTDSYTEAQIQILNGRVHDTCFAIWEMDECESAYGAYHNEYYRTMQAETPQGRGCKNMPDFTLSQLETLREKIGKRYLACAERWVIRRDVDAKYEMEYHAKRLAEIGFDPPEHDFTKPAPLVVPVYHYDGAVFVTDPEISHDDDSNNCECAKCYHSRDNYEDEDSCDCDNCMDNLNHWTHHGRDPTHCNFCKEFAEHLGVEEEEED